MKKALFFALVLTLVPVAAMAGMSAVSDLELEQVKGQTGLTIGGDTDYLGLGIFHVIGLTVEVEDMGWGDSDGFGAYSTEGWVVLDDVTLPSMYFGGEFDVGSNAANETVLQWQTYGVPLIQGNLNIGDVIIGTTFTATTQSIGEIDIKGLRVGFGSGVLGDPSSTVQIKGH